MRFRLFLLVNLPETIRLERWDEYTFIERSLSSSLCEQIALSP